MKKQETPDINILAGQRLMVGFDGTEFNSELQYLINDLKVGGIILFAGNIESALQVKKLCRDAQDYAASCGLPPLFIAVDQEGGVVARLKPPDFTSFPGNPHIKNLDDAIHFATITAQELQEVHINMDFAPVMDSIPCFNEEIKREKDEGNGEKNGEGNCIKGQTFEETKKFNHLQEKKPFESIMKERAFKGSPRQVGELGAQVITTLQNNGVMAVAKHFPGIGRTTLDSHLDLPVLDAAPELLASSDIIPFKTAVKAGVSGIMLSHILYSKIDPKWPASLSRKIAKKLLRDELGYNGLVMTDDLDMKAIKCDIRTSITQILDAEVDLALICHKGPDIEKAFMLIKKLISKNELLLEKATESWQRIYSLKKKYLH
ncbi:NagZ [Desulfamplus magnetovallimortis]|uniref:beta-N-acetylhexosaminidase n=1 Tax=Desulfamplus magnetovallimortis TaxID=1246637 RepID=A0A1W1HCE6_9BACT|nr:glycoside hydrolase family 3 N-terminal domain-containing protein [Desulfamplus magnetovallimortis]SLM30113.1 NagZ [Desulfamplus magnetovallimortis]